MYINIGREHMKKKQKILGIAIMVLLLGAGITPIVGAALIKQTQTTGLIGGQSVQVRQHERAKYTIPIEHCNGWSAVTDEQINEFFVDHQTQLYSIATYMVSATDEQLAYDCNNYVQSMIAQGEGGAATVEINGVSDFFSLISELDALNNCGLGDYDSDGIIDDVDTDDDNDGIPDNQDTDTYNDNVGVTKMVVEEYPLSLYIRIPGFNIWIKTLTFNGWRHHYMTTDFSTEALKASWNVGHALFPNALEIPVHINLSGQWVNTSITVGMGAVASSLALYTIEGFAEIANIMQNIDDYENIMSIIRDVLSMPDSEDAIGLYIIGEMNILRTMWQEYYEIYEANGINPYAGVADNGFNAGAGVDSRGWIGNALQTRVPEDPTILDEWTKILPESSLDVYRVISQ